MGKSIVNFTRNDRAGSSWGILEDGKVYPLLECYKSHRELMSSYFSNKEMFVENISETGLDPQSLKFNSPVSPDVQLFCQGLNYADHREESGGGGEESSVFMKAASSICGPNETILRPQGCQLLDYEIELALVLKEGLTQLTKIDDKNLASYVGGLVLCNDVSARDFMFGAPMLQWFKGKSQRTFCPMGPVLYLMDEDDFKYLFSLQLILKLNGNVKQSATTDLLIHRPAETLSEISGFADMAAGDCLLTGTPGGVLAQTNIKVGLSILLNFTNDKKRRQKFTQAQLSRTRFLEPGDQLELSIRTANGEIDLGVQRNEIADVIPN